MGALSFSLGLYITIPLVWTLTILYELRRIVLNHQTIFTTGLETHHSGIVIDGVLGLSEVGKQSEHLGSLSSLHLYLPQEPYYSFQERRRQHSIILVGG